MWIYPKETPLSIRIGKLVMKRDDLRDLYILLEELNDFFHQPDNYSSVEQVQRFAKKIYPDISKMYYETVWKSLPKDVQEELVNR